MREKAEGFFSQPVVASRLLRHGCGTPRPLARGLSGFVASLLAGQFAQQSVSKSVKSVRWRVQFSGSVLIVR